MSHQSDLAALREPGASVTTAQAQSEALKQIFVLLATSNKPQLTAVEQLIEAGQGRVTHTFPHQAVIAAIPASASLQSLRQLPGVVLAVTEPVSLPAVAAYGPDASGYAAVWNELVAPPIEATGIEVAEHLDNHNDAFIAPDAPPAGQLEIAASSSVRPGYYQTSEYMAGSVAVGIILVESDGSLDPSIENWTVDEKQRVFSEVVAGLNWWTKLEPRANLRFIYDDHFSNPLPTRVEPITRPYYHQQYWIKDAMGALGYKATSYFSRVRDYNNDLRAAYHTDWAFTIFVVDSSVDSDNRFSDGYFAYAYLGGPFMVMTYGNNGYGSQNMDAVAAHEMGHIFYALDQYYSANQPCTRRSGYLDIENQNSQYGACALSAASIMRGQTYPYFAEAIDPYAAGQVGWRDSDNDNILDPLDTQLPLDIDTIIHDGNSVTVAGTARIVPYPSPSHPSVTINRLTGVQYRFDTGKWQQAIATDGLFDGTTEAYQFTAASLSPGVHALEVAALDSAGNVSGVYAAETITILDPVDGGLNTEFDSSGVQLAGPAVTINGVAYHLTGGRIAKVQYRIDGGPWQSARARDGGFDSDYEPFTVELTVWKNGVHLIEAFATDADGYSEVNLASRQIQLYDLYLPLVGRGM